MTDARRRGVRIAWRAVPSSEELGAGVQLLATLASHTPRQGAFR